MLARRITSLHKGELSFSSEEGKGSIFTVTLPIIRREPARMNPDIKSDVQGNNEHSTDIILFVDDNADLRAYFQMSFSVDYKVITVENGKKALDYLKDNECDIVVSDVMMPVTHFSEPRLISFESAR